MLRLSKENTVLTFNGFKNPRGVVLNTLCVGDKVRTNRVGTHFIGRELTGLITEVIFNETDGYLDVWYLVGDEKSWLCFNEIEFLD